MHTKPIPIPLRSLAAAIALLSPAIAHSQLEEVIVTAQKRAESQQDVPISISTVTGAKLDDFQVVDLQALSGTAPNVQIQHFGNTPHGAVFNIRGMGVIEPDPYAGQTVTTVVDGVPLAFNMISLLDLYDVERIEIHRGPQGTLFGANTTGGVINVVTRQPTGEFGGDLKVTVGDWDRLDLKGTLNFPITDTLAGKITGQYYSRDGWVKNVVNGDTMGDREVQSWRGYLKWEPSDNFDATFIGEYTESENGAPIVINGSYPGEVTYQEPGLIAAPGQGAMYTGPCPPDPSKRCSAPDSYYSANSSVRDVSNQDVWSGTLTMNWHADWGEITSITGVKDFDLYEETDQDGGVLFIDDTRRDTEGTQYSQELRFTLDPTENIQVITGAFYQYNEWDHYQNFRIPFAGPLRQLTENDWENWSASLFAHAFIDLSDKLRLQVGGRYSYEETKADVLVTTYVNPDPDGTSVWEGDVLIPEATVRANGDENWDDWAAKIGLDYQLTDDAMVYGFASRGFKSGGFVGRIAVPEDIGPYDPETVETVELGVKSEWWDNRLRVNASGFFNWYDDLQLAVIYFCTDQATGATINCNSITNAAEAETWGLEFEVEAVPVDSLTLSASAGYLSAEYKDFPFFDGVTGQTVDLSGEDLQNSPDWTASLGATYEFSLFSGTTTLGARYSYTGSKFIGNLQNTARSEVQPIKYLDANIKWTPASERWDINLWATNLLDDRYIDSIFDGVSFIGLMSYGPPRQWGVSVDYFF